MQDLKALEGKTLAELREIAKAIGIRNVMVKKRELIEKIAGTAAESPAETAAAAETASTEAPATAETAKTAETPAAEEAPKGKRGRRPRLAKTENAADNRAPEDRAGEAPETGEAPRQQEKGPRGRRKAAAVDPELPMEPATRPEQTPASDSTGICRPRPPPRRR